MRHAAWLPVCAVIIGSAAGVCWRCPPVVWWSCLLAGWGGLALALLIASGNANAHAGRQVRSHYAATVLSIVSTMIGFAGVSGLLASHDAKRARRPPLLEALARLERDPTACGGQQTGGPTYSCDIVADVEGRLKDDASMGEFGVSFMLAVDRLHGGRDPPIGEPLPANGKTRVDVDIDGAVDGAVRVTVGGDAARARMGEWRAGRRIRAPVFLRAPLPYRNFGVADQRERLALAGVSLFGSIKSATLVDVIARGAWWEEWAAFARAWTRRAIARHVGRAGSRDGGISSISSISSITSSADAGTGAAIVVAVLIGERAGLSVDVERRLQRAGTYHVIAISGGNIAILTGLLLSLLRVLFVPPRVRLCVTAVLIVAYALAIDAGPSVVRATLAAVAYLLTRAIDLEARSLEILACVVLLMLIVTPLDIVNAGFWLTCGATLGILLHSEAVATAARRRLRLRLSAAAFWVIGLVVTTLCAEVMVAPVTALAFSQLTFAGLLLNFAAIPLMTVVQVAGMLVLALQMLQVLHIPHLDLVTAAITAASDAVGLIAHFAAMGIVKSAELVDLAPWMAMRVAPPPVWLVVVYGVLWCVVWIARLGMRVRVASAVGWSVCVALIVLAPPWSVLSGEGASGCEVMSLPAGWRERPWWRLTTMDVGQGGSAVLQTSDGRALLVDAGGTNSAAFDVGARVVSPSLWALGIRRLDALALTHGDIDHVGGALAVVEDFRPREVWSAQSLTRAGPAVLRAIGEAASARGARLRTLGAGDEMTFGRASLRVWNPAAQPASAPASTPGPLSMPRARSPSFRRNDESLVMEVRVGEVSIVLPGDIGAAVERRVARALPGLCVLAAPHHGSRLSSSDAFLDALSPRVVMISAGLNNRHGHPAAETLERYRVRGVDVYRTDLDGAIQLLTDGRVVHVATCGGRGGQAGAS